VIIIKSSLEQKIRKDKKVKDREERMILLKQFDLEEYINRLAG
jgi:hypothetical protein